MDLLREGGREVRASLASCCSYLCLSLALALQYICGFNTCFSFFIIKDVPIVTYCFRNHKEFTSLRTQYKIKNASHRKLLHQLLLQTNRTLHKPKTQDDRYSLGRPRNGIGSSTEALSDTRAALETLPLHLFTSSQWGGAHARVSSPPSPGMYALLTLTSSEVILIQT